MIGPWTTFFYTNYFYKNQELIKIKDFDKIKIVIKCFYHFLTAYKN